VSGHAHQLVQALRVLMREARQLHGCAGAHLAADADEADGFWYHEDWLEVGALERELRTDRFAQLLALMETCAERPTVEFRVVTEIQGLEYVAAVREAAGRPDTSEPPPPVMEPDLAPGSRLIDPDGRRLASPRPRARS
jgi:quinol monooxygenase YgiN